VETGQAPDRIVAHRPEKDDAPAMTRPLVPWPQRVKYDGDGDVNDAGNFVLR